MGLTYREEKLLDMLTEVALEVEERGHSLTELTGLIGELSACKVLGLTWEPSTGYDAVGPDRATYQVKSRRSSTGREVNPQGRLGRFGKKESYNFTKGLLVELDSKYNIRHILCADVSSIKSEEKMRLLAEGCT